MKNLIFSLFKILLMTLGISFVLNGCGEDEVKTLINEDNKTLSTTTTTINNDKNYTVDIGVFGRTPIKNLERNPIKEKIKLLAIKALDISLIGDAKAKYNIDKSDESIYKELDSIASVGVNLSNKDNPVILKNGNFYHIDTTFDIEGEYENGVNFEVVLVNNSDNSAVTLFNKTIELEEDGEQHFEVDVLIPFGISTSKYTLIVYLVDSELENRVNKNKKITDTPEIGATYVNIENDNELDGIQLLDTNSIKYIDIPSKTKFKDGHTTEKNGHTSFLFSNIVQEDKKTTISATLEFDNEDSIELYLLDSQIAEVSKKVEYAIPAKKAETFMDSRYTIDITYYLPQSEYDNILKKLPDLSKDKNSDGLKGKIKWSITIDGETKETIEAVLVSKMIKRVSLYSNLTLFNPTIVRPTLVTTGAGLNINTSILPKIDSALYMDNNHTYVFHYNSYAKFDINTQEIVDEWVPINNNWEGLMSDDLERIDASFRNSDIIYFFHGDTYSIYRVSKQADLNKVTGLTELTPAVGIPEQITRENPFLGTMPQYLLDTKRSISSLVPDMPFTHVDSAFYNKKDDILYLFSDNNYIEIKKWSTLREKEISEVKSVKDKWGDVGTTGAMRLARGVIIFLDNKGNVTRRLNKPELEVEDIFLSKIANIDNTKGEKSKAALQFTSNMGIENRWYVPSSTGYATADLKFYLFDEDFSLLSLDGEIAISLGEGHPSLSEIFKPEELKKIRYRTGMKLKFSTLGYVWLDKGKVKEKTVLSLFDASEDKSDSEAETVATAATLGAKATAEAAISERSDSEETEKAKESCSLTNCSKTWREEEILFVQPFPLGPIVIIVSGGVKGEMGTHTTLGFDDEGTIGVKISSSLPTQIQVFTKAEIDYYGARAGVKGTISLVETNTTAELSAGLKIERSAFNFYIHAQSDFELRLIQADLSVYAGIRTKVKWCSMVPCGLGWHDWTYSIYKTSWLYNEKWSLLKYDKLLHEMRF